jgi:hypothetical protein
MRSAVADATFDLIEFHRAPDNTGRIQVGFAPQLNSVVLSAWHS